MPAIKRHVMSFEHKVICRRAALYYFKQADPCFSLQPAILVSNQVHQSLQYWTAWWVPERLIFDRTCYFVILDRTWGEGVATLPTHLPPICNRASQRRRESLGCSESSHTQFYYPRSRFDLCRAGQIKYDVFLHDQRFGDSLFNKER